MKNYRYMNKPQLIRACEKMESEILELKSSGNSFQEHVVWLINTSEVLLKAARMLIDVRREDTEPEEPQATMEAPE